MTLRMYVDNNCRSSGILLIMEAHSQTSTQLSGFKAATAETSQESCGCPLNKHEEKKALNEEQLKEEYGVGARIMFKF